MAINVFEEEYWLPCHDFPNYKISSLGRVWDNETDEEVPQTYSNLQIRARMRYGPNEFRGAVWQMMYATFWQAGWGMDVEISYRDDNPKNLSMFNLKFDKDGKPLLYRLDENTGLWHTRRGGRARKVQVVETGELFDSVPQLVRELELERNAVYMCLRGTQNSHHGLSFRYVD